jgi:hypothetical protein
MSMKKSMLIFVMISTSLIITKNTLCQKIFSDTKDPFTNLRTRSTTLSPLYRAGFTNILQVQTSIGIQNDSIISCYFSFLTPEVSVKIDRTDSTLKDICLLKDEVGNIYTGKVTSSGSAIGYNSYVCSFTKTDFLKLMESQISDVKITTTSGKGGLFPIDKKLRDTLQIK